MAAIKRATCNGQLVDGESLAAILAEQGVLPPRQAGRIAAEAARGLAAAHARGLVHGALTPGDIVLARDGRVVLTDFGAGRLVEASDVVVPGASAGLVPYLSPEQVRGEAAGPAADQYALGLVLFESLTGRLPWRGSSAAEIAEARLAGPAPSPLELRAGIPAELAEIDARALATEPGARFAGVDALADALESFLGGTGGPGVIAAGATGAAAAAAVVPGEAAGGPYAADGADSNLPDDSDEYDEYDESDE